MIPKNHKDILLIIEDDTDVINSIVSLKVPVFSFSKTLFSQDNVYNVNTWNNIEDVSTKLEYK